MNPFIDVLAARVHDSFVQENAAAGVTSLPSRRGTGDLMRPFAELDEADRDDDRRTVRTVLAGLAEMPMVQVLRLLYDISDGVFAGVVAPGVHVCDPPAASFVDRCVEAAAGEDGQR